MGGTGGGSGPLPRSPAGRDRRARVPPACARPACFPAASAVRPAARSCCSARSYRGRSRRALRPGSRHDHRWHGSEPSPCVGSSSLSRRRRRPPRRGRVDGGDLRFIVAVALAFGAVAVGAVVVGSRRIPVAVGRIALGIVFAGAVEARLIGAGSSEARFVALAGLALQPADGRAFAVHATATSTAAATTTTTPYDLRRSSRAAIFRTLAARVVTLAGLRCLRRRHSAPRHRTLPRSWHAPVHGSRSVAAAMILATRSARARSRNRRHEARRRPR